MGNDAPLAAVDVPPRSARFAAAVLERGATIGRYLVLSLIGRGGMGEVYAAYDPDLDRRVAIKLLHLARGTADARERLVREARALGKLSHPNVVQVHDVGEHQGDVFVAMELVDGQPLDTWCAGAPKPSFEQILAAYRDAARGLLAAHEKGLVHRDVKPSNILRGKDGRVRVLDFGIAAGDDTASEEERASGSLPGTSAHEENDPSLGDTVAVRRVVVGAKVDQQASLDATQPALGAAPGAFLQRLTETGTLMGTPLYLSPEQYEGRRASPASDQYSLCIALHEGLYGAAPFTAKPGLPIAALLADLYAQKMRGLPSSPPAGSTVPAWVFGVIARGLAPKPEDRYPSMEALVAALTEDSGARARARGRLSRALVGTAALIAIIAVVLVKSGGLRNPCEHPERELTSVWDDDVKNRMRTAFLGTGRPYAEDTSVRVTALLDRYRADWVGMRAEVCEASHRGGGRADVLSLRDVCLDRRRGQLQALTALLAEKPDPQVLDRAVQAASGLHPVAYCADTEALTARVHPPEDPELRARVAALQPQVDRLEALLTAGKYKEGVTFGEPLLADAKAMSYAPLRAQTQYWMGRLRDGDADYTGAGTLLRAAAISAAEGKDDLLAAQAWAWLLTVVGYGQRHFEEAEVIRSLGPTALARVPDERAEAAWLNAEGTLFNTMSKGAEAKAPLERALALLVKVLGPDHPDVAAVLNNLGNAYLDMGDFPRARDSYSRALAVWEKSLGPEHPRVGASLGNLGVLLNDLGDYPAAKASHERSLAIFEKALGPEHPYVGQALNNLACALFEMGEYARAKTVFERAIAIHEKTLGPSHPHLADDLAYLGRTEVRLGLLDEAFLRLDRARAAMTKPDGKSFDEMAVALLGLGELELSRHNPETAAAYLEGALPMGDAKVKPEVQLLLADTLWQLGKNRPRARDLAELARAHYERIGNRGKLDAATKWLAAHPKAE